MNSLILDGLYEKYNIKNLPFGIIHDKLGDLYEEYCVTILSDVEILSLAKTTFSIELLDLKIFKEILKSYSISDFTNISSISATNIVPHRETRGLSKADVILTINYIDKTQVKKAISCKQSSVKKVAFAEFDVDTICREVGISDERLKYLLLKHQTDASAKNMSAEEKKALRDGILPIARRFVRWVITGSPENNPINLVYPSSIIKFNVKKPASKIISVDNGDFRLQSFKSYTVEEYLDTIMTKNGIIKSGGFGTGLSWTYATGSKGVKIQFKG